MHLEPRYSRQQPSPDLRKDCKSLQTVKPLSSLTTCRSSAQRPHDLSRASAYSGSTPSGCSCFARFLARLCFTASTRAADPMLAGMPHSGLARQQRCPRDFARNACQRVQKPSQRCNDVRSTAPSDVWYPKSYSLAAFKRVRALQDTALVGNIQQTL